MAQFEFDTMGIDESRIRGMPTPDLARAMLTLIGKVNKFDDHVHLSSFGLLSTDGNIRPQIELEVREAWAWMVRELILIPWDPNGWHKLSRRGRQLAREAAAGPGSIDALLITPEMLPPAMSAALSNYHGGNYDGAVFEGMKAVEVAVRDASGLPRSLVGVALMRKAFEKGVGPLTDKAADPGEQQAMSDLFAGAMGVFRNATGHRIVGLSMRQAWDALMLAAHLLRLIP